MLEQAWECLNSLTREEQPVQRLVRSRSAHRRSSREPQLLPRRGREMEEEGQGREAGSSFPLLVTLSVAAVARQARTTEAEVEAEAEAEAEVEVEAEAEAEAEDPVEC